MSDIVEILRSPSPFEQENPLKPSTAARISVQSGTRSFEAKILLHDSRSKHLAFQIGRPIRVDLGGPELWSLQVSELLSVQVCLPEFDFI